MVIKIHLQNKDLLKRILQSGLSKGKYYSEIGRPTLSGYSKRFSKSIFPLGLEFLLVDDNAMKVKP
jgi:hypothetical protein